MQVKDVMSTEFTVISPDTTFEQAARLMRDGDFGYLPVGENDRLKGAVTDRDIVIRGLAEGRDLDTPVSRALSEDIIYCYDDDDVDNAAALMEGNQIRRLVVLNRDKRMVGIVSLGDIARTCKDDRLTGRTEIGVVQLA